MAIKTAKELAAACKKVATEYKTLYVMGCFGAPMNSTNKTRYIDHHEYNRRTDRKPKIQAASAETFGFDCVCLIKGLLWGWDGDAKDIYGGANYCANGVPDIDANGMIGVCSGVSTDFSNIEVGEVVWMRDHIGVYIGNGLAVECTPSWKDGVQITAVKNIGTKSGYDARKWTSHGKLPYVTYETAKNAEKTISGVPALQFGKTGKSVKAMQILLIGYGYTCGSSGADGSFGNATLSSLKKYQKDKGLDVDGSCGPKTWAKLLGL